MTAAKTVDAAKAKASGAQAWAGEQGNVAIVVALMATALIGMGALAIDFGAMLVRQSQLQSGADAAAIAVARECAGFVVDDQPASCNATQALTTATSYFTDNLPGIAADVIQPIIDTQYDGRAGVVTVSAGTEEPTLFGWALGADDLAVQANAIARWGPMTAVDEVFPLAFCKGALPEPNQQVELWSSPEGDEMLGECDGAPTALPMGWLTPTNSADCTTDVSLLPTTYLQVAPSDDPPTNPGCTDEIDDLLDDIERRRWSWRCRRSCTRVVAVYDAARSPGGRHPAYSLVAIEFTGARLGDREEHRPPWRDWNNVCEDEDPYAMEALQCIRGTVRLHDPPDDGPIIGPGVLGPLGGGGISDSTVLDVRLVD